MPTEMIEGFPLSLQQKRLWSFSGAAPETELISEAEFVIEGKLDHARFEQALRRVIERHEICRSVIKTIPGIPEPVQVVAEELDLRTRKTGERLENAPVLDWELTGDGGERHEGHELGYELRVRFPAASADYTSLGLFIENLAAQYGHVIRGTKDESEPMQYPDYAQWQADLQTSSEARPGHQFWRRLEEEAVRPALPLEKAGHGFQKGLEARHLPDDLLARLEGFASGDATQRGTAMAAAWAAFCGRLAETNSEVRLGIYSAGRNFEELKGALGPYDRYLPVRAGLKEESSAADAIQVVREAYRAARQHQEFFGGSNPRDMGMEFLFAHRESAPAFHGGGVRFAVRSAESHAEPFKLKLEFVEGEPPEFRLFYNARRFSREHAAILADRFEAFLADFLKRTEVPIRTLNFASRNEIELALGSFAQSGDAEPKARSVIELFEAEAKQHPRRPAVICGGRVLSYAELNARANQLANRLVRLGVAAGAPVAISAERSCEVIVGLLGIQKAGGSYVPLDPGYPKDRIEFVLRDCGARVLVAQPRLLEKLPAGGREVVALGEAELASESEADPEAAIDPDNAAYVIYTSGSTGQPKGVAITHRNLAYSTAARHEYYNEPVANYLLLSSFAFDSSIAGIFWTLSQGGALTIPREGTHQDPKELLALAREHKVSHLLTLPSFYQALLEQAAARDVASLRTVIVAGEACPVDLVRRHFAKTPNARLYNEYGPTEGTVWSTVHRCERDESGIVPIGRPAPNMSVYLLNERMEPVGIGSIGEIYIGGPAVARGYLGREELTVEKFVASPWNQAGGKLYRTGDLGRHRTDGVIEFHGRIDEQVKIRGHRIEMGEIECVLARHPEVREAVVAAREDTPGDQRLVAYVTAKDQAHLSIPKLRLFAREKLPRFMVPTQFVPLPALPLTPNGKIDRNALPAPEEWERNEKRVIAPRNPEEELLARIWSDVLKLEIVGIEENFFDLGGHSILAIQVIARVRDSFKLELPMAAFFEAPTIGGMAVALERCRETKGPAGGGIRRVARVAATDELLARLNNGAQ